MNPHVQFARRYVLALNFSGAISSALQFELYSIETISFIENAAFDYGGAISIANPVMLNISGVNFAFNEADSGGAVALTSTVRGTAEFQHCRFEYNKATHGGALYLSGDGSRLLQGSMLRYNIAGKISFRETFGFARQPGQLFRNMAIRITTMSTILAQRFILKMFTGCVKIPFQQ